MARNAIATPVTRPSSGLARWRDWLEAHPVYGLAVVFLILPVVVPEKTLVTNILTYGLFAVSFNLLLGYTGLLSFGHSTFLGLGSYAAALFLVKLQIVNLWLALLAGVAFPAVVAIGIGWFCLRRRMVYFSMLTLAFNQMVFFIVFQLRDITGGDDGLRGIPIPNFDLPGISFTIDSIREPMRFYFFVYVLVVLCLFAVFRIVQSPFGRALQAIRESEERARAIGYDTQRVQHLSFFFAGAFAGLAGALNALFFGFVALETLSWFTAGIAVIMTILGGKGTFVGPFIGATVYLLIQEYTSKDPFLGLVANPLAKNWPLLLGGTFVLMVLFLPQGLWGTYKDWLHRRRSAAEQNAGPKPINALPVAAVKE